MQIANSPSQIEPPPVIAGGNTSAAECEPLPDTELTARVKAALVAAGDFTAKQILIEAVDGVVFLSGPVDSAAMKQVTLAAAERVCGARDRCPVLIARLRHKDVQVHGSSNGSSTRVRTYGVHEGAAKMVASRLDRRTHRYVGPAHVTGYVKTTVGHEAALFRSECRIDIQAAARRSFERRSRRQQHAGIRDHVVGSIRTCRACCIHPWRSRKTVLSFAFIAALISTPPE
jgi:hypothetical protein